MVTDGRQTRLDQTWMMHKEVKEGIETEVTNMVWSQDKVQKGNNLWN